MFKCNLFLIGIAFDFSIYNLLVQQIQQMTIFISKESSKCGTLSCKIMWNSVFEGFYFEKYISLGDLFNNMLLFALSI